MQDQDASEAQSADPKGRPTEGARQEGSKSIFQHPLLVAIVADIFVVIAGIVTGIIPGISSDWWEKEYRLTGTVGWYCDKSGKTGTLCLDPQLTVKAFFGDERNGISPNALTLGQDNWGDFQHITNSKFDSIIVKIQIQYKNRILSTMYLDVNTESHSITLSVIKEMIEVPSSIATSSPERNFSDVS